MGANLKKKIRTKKEKNILKNEEFNQIDHNAVYKRVKSDEFWRG